MTQLRVISATCVACSYIIIFIMCVTNSTLLSSTRGVYAMAKPCAMFNHHVSRDLCSSSAVTLVRPPTCSSLKINIYKSLFSICYVTLFLESTTLVIPPASEDSVPLTVTSFTHHHLHYYHSYFSSPLHCFIPD